VPFRGPVNCKKNLRIREGPTPRKYPCLAGKVCRLRKSTVVADSVPQVYREVCAHPAGNQMCLINFPRRRQRKHKRAIPSSVHRITRQPANSACHGRTNNQAWNNADSVPQIRRLACTHTVCYQMHSISASQNVETACSGNTILGPADHEAAAPACRGRVHNYGKEKCMRAPSVHGSRTRC